MLAVARGQINKEYIDKNTKRGITLEKIKNSKNKKKLFWRVTSRVLCPNFKFLAQTVLAVAQKLQFLQSKNRGNLTLLLTKDLFGSKIGGFQKTCAQKKLQVSELRLLKGH